MMALYFNRGIITVETVVSMAQYMPLCMALYEALYIGPRWPYILSYKLYIITYYRATVFFFKLEPACYDL